MTRMAALGIRNLSRRALFSFEDEFSVFGYGSRCEDRVYCLSEEYDHLSAIRSVSVNPSHAAVAIHGVEDGRISFNSDYSGEGGASLLFFKVSHLTCVMVFGF